MICKAAGGLAFLPETQADAEFSVVHVQDEPSYLRRMTEYMSPSKWFTAADEGLTARYPRVSNALDLLEHSHDNEMTTCYVLL